MISDFLLYAGSIIVIVWGIAHIMPTQSVVDGFGSLTLDNKRLLTMEWVAEGLGMIFIGVLTLLVTLQASPSNPVATLVYSGSAVMLVVMAGWTAVTGSRTAILPIKICPFVKTGAALLLILGMLF